MTGRPQFERAIATVETELFALVDGGKNSNVESGSKRGSHSLNQPSRSVSTHAKFCAASGSKKAS